MSLSCTPSSAYPTHLSMPDHASQTKKKCKIKLSRRKLVVGDHVEVRSTEDGFHGSWHSATVVECGDLVRRVRYDNLLVDDATEILVESISVSSTIDGVFPINGVPVNYRGVIRPVPPPSVIDRWGFHYALCVDAYVNDAWWEGVVFDYEAGSDERLVFFPDLGDEQMVEIVNLRVTRDWDEVTERWIERGDWLFLRLVEEQEKELFFCVSVKQLWYDARAKEDFRMSIKEWTCWIRPMWDDIVREVICDNTNLTAQHFLSVIESETSQISSNGWSNSTSSNKSDTTLHWEGRSNSTSGNESVYTLPCEGILQDNVDGSQFALSSSGPSQRTRSSTKCDTTPPCKSMLQDNVDENRVVSSLRGPSKRTRSCTDNSDFTLLCNGILQDNVEGNQLISSSRSQRMSSTTKCDTTLLCKDILQDSVKENRLVSSLQDSTRKTGSCTDKSDFTLPCVGILQDKVEGNLLRSSSQSQRTGSSTQADSTLPCEGIVQDNVDEGHLALSLLGPSKRKTRRITDKLDFTLHCEGTLQDHVEENQLAVTSSGRIQRTGNTKSDTTLSCEDILQHNVEENQLVLSSPSPSKRTTSTDKCYFTRRCEDNIRDHVEENQLALGSPEETRLKRKADSSNMHRITKKVKGSFEPKLGGRVDKSAALRFQIVRDSNGGALAIKGNLGVLPMRRIKGKSSPSIDFMENRDCDSEAIHSDPNLFSQINSVTDNRGDYGDDMVNSQEGMVIQDALKYLRIARGKSCPREPHDKRNALNKVKDHLLDMGWEIKHVKHEKMDRVHYITPEGRIFYSLIKVCETLTETEEMIATPCSQNINKNLVDSSVKQLKSRVQQVAFPEFLQQNCVSEGCVATPLGKAMVPNRFKIKTGPTGDDRGDPKIDMLKTQGGRIVEGALLNYLYIVRGKSHPHNRKSAMDEVQMHLLDMGWEIKRSRDMRDQLRTYYYSPEGKNFYSLVKVCEYLRTAKEITTTQCSQNINNSLVNSSVMSLGSSVQQASFQEILQQHRVSEGCGATPLSKARALDQCKRKEGSTGDVSPLSEPLALTVEPAYNRKAMVEHYARGNIAENVMELCFKSRNILSSSGCTLGHISKKGGNRLCCISPSPNYKVYSSLLTTQEGSIEQGFSEGTEPMQGNTMDGEYKNEPTHCHLTSAIVCNGTDKCLLPRKNCTDISGLSGSREFKLGKIKVGVRAPRKRAMDNTWPFTSTVNSSSSYTRQDGLVSCSKTQGGLDQNPGQKKQNSVRALNRKGNKLDGTYPSRVLRSHKRARRVIASNPEQLTPRTILSWLIDNNVVLPREKVYYRKKNQRRSMAEGRITRDGIKCNCCQKVYGISSFEAHAGSPYHRPAENIFLEDGRSLLDCQKKMLQETKLIDCSLDPYQRIKSNKPRVKNDCICSVCHYGGILLLCDQCPSSFHLSCTGLEKLPKGKWFCPACRCAICGLSDFNGNMDKLTDNTILYCDQCERQYHLGCTRKRRAVKFNSCLKENWFCGDTCEKIYMGLHRLLGKSIAVGVDNLSWTILKFSEDHVHTDASNTVTMAELHSKLNVALAVMHECFEPIKEPQTKDLVKDVLFNRRSVLKRLDFRGFYTVLLEKEDELISVATVRVYGEKVAELPLVGTRFQYRRRGMCRILMNLLEKKLAQFGVERLMLPAIPQVLQAWTTSFGFSKMTDSERLEFLEYTFLDFQGTTMCQKLLKNVVTLKVIGPRANSQGCDNGHLNLSNDDVAAVSVGNVAPKVARQNEKSDIMKQMEVEVTTHNKGSVIETLSPANTLTQPPWSNHKEDKGGEKRYRLKYYRRRGHRQHNS